MEDLDNLLDDIINEGIDDGFEKRITEKEKLTIKQQKDFEEKHWFFKYRIDVLKKMIKGYIPTSENKNEIDILDIGIGTGTLSKELENYGNVVHIECNENIINFNPDIECIKGVFPWGLKLPDKKFDVVVLFNLIEYMDNISWILYITKNLLKPNGRILISTLNGKELSKNDKLYEVKRRYSLDDFKKMCKEGNLKIYYSTCFENLSMKDQLKSSLNKLLAENEIYLNFIPENNDEIYKDLKSRELPTLGVSNKNTSGNQIFLVLKGMTKEEIDEEVKKASKNNQKAKFIDLAIDAIVKLKKK